MKRLEEIVSLFDQGSLTLDEMEQYFTEGMQLLKQCGDRLDQVETKISRLVRETQNRWSEVPFDASRGEDENSPAGDSG